MKIYFFGHENKEVPNTNCCGISQSPGENASEFEVFKELEAFLKTTDVWDKINLSFEDLTQVNLLDFPELNNLLKDYSSPVILIDNKEFIVGRFHNVNVYIKIKSLL